MEPSPGPKLTTTSPRREWAIVLLFTVVGAVIRFWNFGHLGLQHFDEGVYGICGPIVFPHGLEAVGKTLASYAPPGFPFLVGIAYLLFGVCDSSAIVVSVLAGIATIPLAALIAQRWLGPGRGAIVAALAALSGPHVAFSRMALTDATFLFAWLLGMLVGGWFLERPGVLRALILGLVVGLAQNVKYNGFVIGLIVALAGVVGLVVRWRAEHGRGWVRLFVMLFVAGCIAGLVYYPWFHWVDVHIGYRNLMRHHAGYFEGPRGWFEGWRLQMAQEAALSGGLAERFQARLNWGTIAGPLGFIGLLFVWKAEQLRPLGSTLLRLGALSLLWASCVGLSAGLGWWLGLFGFLPMLRDQRLGPRLLPCWWLVMTLLVPLYHPYARLWLPLHAAGWLMIAAWIPRCTGEGLLKKLGIRSPSLAMRAAALGFFTAMVFGTFGFAGKGPLPGLLQPTDSLREHFSSVLENLPPASSDPLLVLARPNARFYTSFQNARPLMIWPIATVHQLVTHPISDTGILLDEVMVAQEPGSETELKGLFERYEIVPGVQWTETLGPVTWLDLNPKVAFGEPVPRTYHWWLLRSRK